MTTTMNISLRHPKESPLGLALLLVLAGSPAWCLNNETAGTSGASFMKIGQGSARAMGIGRAYVALAEGTDALVWNQAGLALTQQKELSYSYLAYVENIGSPLYFAYAHPVGRSVWGANIGYLSVEGPDASIDARDANGVPLNNQELVVRNAFGTVGVGRSFWYEKLFLGGGLRFIHEDIAGVARDVVVGDFGVLLKPNSVLSLGGSVQNFGSNKTNVATVGRVGAGMRLGDFVTLAFEVNKASDDTARIGVGGEFQLPEEYLEVGQVAVRVGYYNADHTGFSYNPTLQNLNLDRSTGVSFGLGVFTSRIFGYGLGLDWAFVPAGALGSITQISAKVKF
ncbi:MAG: hypothetical protein HZB91_10360 [Elusimicrobia bacterium]|nr:hypothetical protein [Elusimicrobiota bacterium]